MDGTIEKCNQSSNTIVSYRACLCPQYLKKLMLPKPYPFGQTMGSVAKV